MDQNARLKAAEAALAASDIDSAGSELLAYAEHAASVGLPDDDPAFEALFEGLLEQLES